MDSGTHNPSHREHAVRERAWVWLRTLNAGEATAWDAEGFKQWLNASPEHRAAFAEAKAQWALMRPLAGEALRTDPELARRRAARRPRPGRRMFLRAVAGTSLAAVAGWAVVRPPAGLWPSMQDFIDADVRTAIGEQRMVQVARAEVTLNTRTSIRHRAGGSVSGIELLDGEAAIDLARDSDFLLVAGAGRCIARAGRFEVRYLDGLASVTCIEGAVRVEHAAGVRTLRAGQQARYDGRAISGVADADTTAISAWRRGLLVFHGASLGAVLDEINRYRPGRVVLMNDAMRAQSVSGSFHVAALDDALRQLQHTFGLHARALPAGWLILS